MAETVVVERSHRWWALRRGLAIGVGAAGGALLLWGAWFARERPVHIQHPVNTDVHIWSLVLVVGTVAAVVLRVLLVRWAERRAALPEPPEGDPVIGATQWLILLVLALLADAGWVIWAGASGLDFQVDAGYVTGSRFAVAVGATGIVAGLLLSVRRPIRHRTPLRQRDGCSAVVGVAIVLVPVVIFSGAAPTIGVHHPTVTAEAIPAVPARVTHQAWTLRTPGPITGLVAAGPGVVITTGTGIEAIDGRTGRVRWSYQRDGTDVGQLQVSPDGRYVSVDEIAANSPYDLDADEVLRVFDAQTGQVPRTLTYNSAGPLALTGPARYRLTDTALVLMEEYQRRNGFVLEAAATSIATGHRLWATAPVPVNNDGPVVANGSVVADGGILIAGLVQPGGPTALTSYDLTDGHVRWRERFASLDGAGIESPDGSLVTTLSEAGATAVYNAATGRRVPTPAGFTVSNVLDHGRVLLTRGPVQSILDASSGIQTAVTDPCLAVDPAGFPAGFDRSLSTQAADLSDGSVCLRPGPGGHATVMGTAAPAGGLGVSLGRGSAHPTTLAAPGAVVLAAGLPNDAQTAAVVLIGLQ